MGDAVPGVIQHRFVYLNSKVSLQLREVYYAAHKEMHWKDLSNVYYTAKTNSDVVPLSPSDNPIQMPLPLQESITGPATPLIHVLLRIKGKGFHRKIELECIPEETISDSDECSLLVLQHLPNTAYIDLDEMRVSFF